MELNRGRPKLSEFERKQKKLFDSKIREFGVEAIENIHKIAVSAMDVSIRLKANIWIAERLVGKDYVVCNTECEEDKQ